MKTYLLCIAFFVCSISYAQEIKYADLGTAEKGDDYTSYVSKTGAVYKVGERIKIGAPSNGGQFNYITFGDGIVVPVTPLPAGNAGNETEIKKIAVVGTKRSGYYVYFRTKGATGIANYSIQVEAALEAGELKGSGMTSDEALSALKKAKDKLDLGLITQADFDKLKAELSQYIK